MILFMSIISMDRESCQAEFHRLAKSPNSYCNQKPNRRWKVRLLGHRMLKGKSANKAEAQEARLLSQPERPNHGRIMAGPECSRCLDSVQLRRLEQSFRDWARDAARSDVRLSRRRILLIFLLIRYTGARLNEVLGPGPVPGHRPRPADGNFQSLRGGSRPACPGSPVTGDTDPGDSGLLRRCRL